MRRPLRTAPELPVPFVMSAVSEVSAVTKITKAENYGRPTISIRVAVAIGRIAVRIIVVIAVIITGAAVSMPVFAAVKPAVSSTAMPAVHLLNEAFVQFRHGSAGQSAH